MALALCGAGSAIAGNITLQASSQGWINSAALASGAVGAINYYFAGNCASYDCEDDGGEYRNFFEFSIPTLSGPIVSAQLVLYSSNIGFDQSASLTYQVTSLSAGFGFASLGTGSQYGSRTYSAEDHHTTHNIDLSALALQHILAAEGRTFRLGGRVVAGAAFGPFENDQWVFGAGHSLQHLTITTSDAPGPVPEPSSLLLFAPGLALLVAVRRGVRGAR